MLMLTLEFYIRNVSHTFDLHLDHLIYVVALKGPIPSLNKYIRQGTKK